MQLYTKYGALLETSTLDPGPVECHFFLLDPAVLMDLSLKIQEVNV